MERYIAGYVRVSTEMQIERDSLENQKVAIKSHGEALGKPCRLFVDAGFSAKDTERTALKELMGEIRAGRVEKLVVTKLDRLTRSLRDLVDLYELFDDRDVSLVSLTQSLDTSNPVGRFVFYILGLVAQMERELTAEREMENMQARARRGKWNGGPTPYGYTCYSLEIRRWLEGEAKRAGARIEELMQDHRALNSAQSHALATVGEPKTLVVDEDEAKVVRDMYETFLRLRSLRGVTHHVNRMGRATRQGVPWAATSIKRILSNPFYKGTLAYNRRKGYKRTSKQRPSDEHILVGGAIPPIVDEGVWARAQEILEEQRRIPSAQKRSRLLLSGLVHCARCGWRMYGSGTKKHAKREYQYYRCNAHLAKGPSVCRGTSVPIETLDRTIVNAVRTIGMKPDAIREQLKDQQYLFERETVPLLEKERTIQDALRRNEHKRMRLIELYEDEAITREDFHSRRIQLDADRAQLEQEVAAVRARLNSAETAGLDVEQAVGMLANLGSVYDGLDLDGRRELIRTVLKDIRADEAGVTYKVRVLPDDFMLGDCMGAHAATSAIP